MWMANKSHIILRLRARVLGCYICIELDLFIRQTHSHGVPWSRIDYLYNARDVFLLPNNPLHAGALSSVAHLLCRVF